jgi:uncharacterized membrane protein YphA (DoxX/SURF4 family)
MKDNSSRYIFILTKIIAAACLTSMLLCFDLWREVRTFPVTRVISLIPAIPSGFDLILPLTAFISLCAILVLKDPRKAIHFFVIIAVTLAILDLNRWQPWFYQYVLMFFVLSFHNYKKPDLHYSASILQLFKIMLAAIYFWSGLQKLNPEFLSDTFPWLMEPITNHMQPGNVSKLAFLGYVFPPAEIATGIFLLIPRLQKTGVVFVFLMHIFILFVLSPLGHNYNPVVWPWNIAMMCFSVILFLKKDHVSFPLTQIIKFHQVKLITFLFVLMPLLNFFNLWDSYLSHNLYSGNTSNGIIYMSSDVRDKLPNHIKKYVRGETDLYINIKYWCMMELGVPAYPERRNFAAVNNYLSQFADDPSQLMLIYTPKLKAGEK